jgi:hypothetical protein
VYLVAFCLSQKNKAVVSSMFQSVEDRLRRRRLWKTLSNCEIQEQVPPTVSGPHGDPMTGVSRFKQRINSLNPQRVFMGGLNSPACVKLAWLHSDWWPAFSF